MSETRHRLTEAPCGGERTFLDLPLQLDLDALQADYAILGVPHGKPYHGAKHPNDQSRAPDALRWSSSDEDIRYTREHYDFDLGGHLPVPDPIRVVDCGNVRLQGYDCSAHYRDAEAAARQIFHAGSRLLAIGGDHGVSIPLLRALAVLEKPITLVHVDAHLDWRDEIDGEREGYSSPLRRASELPFIEHIVQIGMRGIGSARQAEVDAAQRWGAHIVTAYELHQRGMDAVLEDIPEGRHYYLSIDADGIDPSLMPAVLAPTPGGVNWLQLRQLVRGLQHKGCLVGCDLVEIAPAHDVRGLTLLNAERLFCNVIGADPRGGLR